MILFAVFFYLASVFRKKKCLFFLHWDCQTAWGGQLSSDNQSKVKEQKAFNWEGDFSRFTIFRWSSYKHH